MALVQFSVEIKTDAVLHTDNATVLVGTTPNPPSNCAVSCPGHYLLTASITPRPPQAMAALDGDNEDLRNTMGELMLIPPGYVQHGWFQPQPGARKDIFCLFPQDQFERMMGGPIEWTKAAMFASSDIHDSHIHMAARRLAHEAVTPGMATTVLTDSLATTIAVDVRRYFSARKKVAGAAYTLSPLQLRSIRDLVYAHSEQDLRLSHFADACGLSVRHLTRAFKLTTGMTLASHVADVRLEMAKHMLRDTRLPTKAIAARVGFANVSSFTTAFRRMTGVTPRLFRTRDQLLWPKDEMPEDD
jgi:AraC family transcriptional regulator